MNGRRAFAAAALLALAGCTHQPARNAAPAAAADVKGMTKPQKIRKLLALTGAEDNRSR